MLGMHGTKVSNLGVTQCDLLIAIGTRFSDRLTGNTKTFAKDAKILQFDIDPAEVNKNVTVTASVIGDIREILASINEELVAQNHDPWIAHMMELKEQFPLAIPGEGLSGPWVIDEIYRQTKGEAIITTDVGQHQMWASQFYRYKEPRTFISSGGLGTMGYGLGASIGAQVANPHKQVINIAGDGCFRMNMNEIATAVRQKLPLIEIVINNHVLGMVRQWQNIFYGERYSETILEDAVDFAKVAQALGAEGYTVTTREEFEEVFAQALESKSPVLIDCQVDRDDKVWPMVAPGASISDAFDGGDFDKKNST
jgi:acetolactate synthase-1/2/3 large subunit